MNFQRSATVLLVSDVAVSAAFYQRYLGFDVGFDMGWFASLKHPSGATLDLWLRSHDTVPAFLRRPVGGVVLAFVVEDANAEAAKMAAAGLRIAKALTDNPWGQRNFVVEDPDGVAIDIVQPIPPSPEFLREHGLA